MPTCIEEALCSTSLPTEKEIPQRSLLGIRQTIAALKVRSEAARNTPAGESPVVDGTLVPIFKTPVPTQEMLSADRDAKRRDEDIRKILNERGALRLVGATASPVLAERIASLHRSHPNFSEAVDYVMGEEMLARRKAGALTGLRLLLVGGPGVGKTDFSLTLAKLLGLPTQVISMSSAQSAAALGGSETYWGNTKPGLVWETLVQGHFANPIIVLDEIEKASNAWGDPAGALFQLLEPRTAAIFCDKSVPWLEVDASRVNWIATANEPELIHEAIRSRFLEVTVGAPLEESLRSLIQQLYADLLGEFDLKSIFPAQLARPSETALLGKNIRDAKRLLRAALGQALRSGRPELQIQAQPVQGKDQRIGFI